VGSFVFDSMRSGSTSHRTASGEVPLGAGPEFDRIRNILHTIGSSASGIGDDCALINLGDETLAVSVDVSVQDVHFRREWLSLSEIGWRAAAGALSDLAAVGAEVIGVLTAITAPSAITTDGISELMTGVADAARLVGGKVLGGDLSSGSTLSVVVTVLGRTRTPVRRSGAEAGDGVFVTGKLGGSRAALRLLQCGDTLPPSLRERFVHPVPRIAAGQWLAAHGAHAMIDLSDGLAGDIRHVAAASCVAITCNLNLLPLDDGVEIVAHESGERALLLAAQGGEDYELLVIMPRTFPAEDATVFQSVTGLPLTRIGEVSTGEGVHLVLDGQAVNLTGFDHFR
jgi:thiamine-monophosphate kinase